MRCFLRCPLLLFCYPLRCRLHLCPSRTRSRRSPITNSSSGFVCDTSLSLPISSLPHLETLFPPSAAACAGLNLSALFTPAAPPLRFRSRDATRRLPSLHRRADCPSPRPPSTPDAFVSLSRAYLGPPRTGLRRGERRNDQKDRKREGGRSDAPAPWGSLCQSDFVPDSLPLSTLPPQSNPRTPLQLQLLHIRNGSQRNSRRRPREEQGDFTFVPVQRRWRSPRSYVPLPSRRRATADSVS